MNGFIVTQLRSVLESDPQMAFAYLFGSQASGRTNPMSDLDVAVYTEPALTLDKLLALQSDLMEATRMARLDVVDLRSAPPLLLYEIISAGHLLFTRDPDAVNRFERLALLRYMDTAYLRKVQGQYLRQNLQ